MKVLFFSSVGKNKYTMSARILIVEDHADLRHLRMMLGSMAMKSMRLQMRLKV